MLCGTQKISNRFRYQILERDLDDNIYDNIDDEINEMDGGFERMGLTNSYYFERAADA